MGWAAPAEVLLRFPRWGPLLCEPALSGWDPRREIERERVVWDVDFRMEPGGGVTWWNVWNTFCWIGGGWIAKERDWAGKGSKNWAAEAATVRAITPKSAFILFTCNENEHYPPKLSRFPAQGPIHPGERREEFWFVVFSFFILKVLHSKHKAHSLPYAYTTRAHAHAHTHARTHAHTQEPK